MQRPTPALGLILFLFPFSLKSEPGQLSSLLSSQSLPASLLSLLESCVNSLPSSRPSFLSITHTLAEIIQQVCLFVLIPVSHWFSQPTTHSRIPVGKRRTRKERSSSSRRSRRTQRRQSSCFAFPCFSVPFLCCKEQEEKGRTRTRTKTENKHTPNDHCASLWLSCWYGFLSLALLCVCVRVWIPHIYPLLFLFSWYALHAKLFSLLLCCCLNINKMYVSDTHHTKKSERERKRAWPVFFYSLWLIYITGFLWEENRRRKKATTATTAKRQQQQQRREKRRRKERQKKSHWKIRKRTSTRGRKQQRLIRRAIAPRWHHIQHTEKQRWKKKTQGQEEKEEREEKRKRKEKRTHNTLLCIALLLVLACMIFLTRCLLFICAGYLVTLCWRTAKIQRRNEKKVPMLFLVCYFNTFLPLFFSV